MKKNVFLWALYDFANTPLAAAITGLYLAQWVVLDNHFDDIWYGGVFALSTIFLLVTAPFWGTWSDKLDKRLPFIKWATYALLFFGVLLAIITNSTLPVIPKVILALILFFFIQYAYQFSLIFYDALLAKLSTPKTIGKVSGIGEAFGELGWIIGPGILLPFATGSITLLGQPGRSQVFLPAIVLLAILGLPMIFWFREPKGKNTHSHTNTSSTFKQTITGLKKLVTKNKNVFTFLLSFMLLSDALLTITLYFAIFMDQVYKMSDTQKYISLALLEIIAIPSAFLFGKISDKLGVKKILLVSCTTLIFTFTLASLSSLINIMYLIAILSGVGYGGFYTTSRVLLTKISSPHQLGEYFGFYATFQRFASIIGPLTWGVITLLLRDYGVIKYRIAIMALVLLMLIGTILLTRVREEKALSFDE